MQTVQFECGKCGKLMAVGIEHLGAQVHCPHCMAIVNAPPAEPSAAPPPPSAPIPEITIPADRPEEGSIFGGSDENMFSAPPGPLVEMPASTPAAPAAAPPLDGSFGPPDRPPVMMPERIHRPAAIDDDKTWTDAPTESELPRPDVPRRKESRGMLVPLLLIFLIPYAIICTGFIVWNFIHPPGSAFDPLERLPDPRPGEGGPQRVNPASPLPNKLRTSLQQPIQVGDIEVTPLKVMLIDNNLVLYLKMRNLSKDLAFNPLSDVFAKGNRPYIFLDTGREKLFGGYVDWQSQGQAKKSGVIGPHEENVTRLTTYEKFRPRIKALLHSRDHLVWRVQVRRGFLPVHGRPVSATAVIGVDFVPREVQKVGG